MTEKQVKTKILNILNIYTKYNAVYTFCPMMIGYGERGHPDRVVVLNGTFIGIEAKRDENNHHSRPELKPKPNEAAQKIQAERILSAGGKWVCIHGGNLSDLPKLLDQYASTPSDKFSAADKKRLAQLGA